MTNHDDEFDPFIAGIAQELRRPVSLDARLDDRVMAAIEPRVIPIGVARSSNPWYRRTFSFSVSQVAGLAAAAALVGVVSMNVFAPSTPDATVASTTTESPRSDLIVQSVAAVTRDANAAMPQQFILLAPGAQTVSLVGDFSDWDAKRFQMEKVSDDGAWSITIPLTPGRYEYQFEVDGATRVNDPTRPQTSSDFGSANSVVTVERRD